MEDQLYRGIIGFQWFGGQSVAYRLWFGFWFSVDFFGVFCYIIKLFKVQFFYYYNEENFMIFGLRGYLKIRDGVLKIEYVKCQYLV